MGWGWGRSRTKDNSGAKEWNCGSKSKAGRSRKMSSPGGCETEMEEDNNEAVKYVKTCLTAREGRSPHGGRDGDRVLWFLAAGGQRDGESDNQGTAGNTGAGPNRRAGRQAGHRRLGTRRET